MKTQIFFSLVIVITSFSSFSYASKQGRFNPDISLILDGRFGGYSNTTDYELPGFMLGGEATRGQQGFNIGHNELVFSANVDDMFFAKLTTAIADHEGETEVELEESYIETLTLGSGLTLRAGRFFSDIGYLNNQHGHTWDFTDAPLIYRGLFGNQLIDDGLQLSWVAPSDLYMKLGVEALRGERYPAGGAANKGKGAFATFAKFGGDVGVSHAWQLGFSYWDADIEGREAGVHDHGGNAEIPTFTGNSKITGIDFVWKWAPNGNSRDTYLKIQGEYFIRDEAGTVDLVGSLLPETSSYIGDQSGLYLQAIYQFMPRWRVGYRFDYLYADNTGADLLVLAEAGLGDGGHSPKRSTLMFDYSHSEYSRLRVQYSKDDSYAESDNLFFIQFIATIGAHGAHRF